MFLTVHAASGLIIGKHTDSALLAFIIGFISHIILDLFPHDSIEIKKWKLPENLKFFVIVVFFEFPLILTMLAVLSIYGKIIWTWPMLAGIVGAMSMDFLWGLHKLLPKLKVFVIFDKVNHLSHIVFTKNYHLSCKIWVPIQVVLLSLFLTIFLIV